MQYDRTYFLIRTRAIRYCGERRSTSISPSHQSTSTSTSSPSSSPNYQWTSIMSSPFSSASPCFCFCSYSSFFFPLSSLTPTPTWELPAGGTVAMCAAEVRKATETLRAAVEAATGADGEEEVVKATDIYVWRYRPRDAISHLVIFIHGFSNDRFLNLPASD